MSIKQSFSSFLYYYYISFLHMTNNACKVSKVYLKVESVIMVNDQCQRVLWRWFWVR